MKKFKFIWMQKVVERDEFGDDIDSYWKEMDAIVEAETEDDAVEKFNNEYPEAQGNIDEIIEIIEHELFKKNLIVEMSNGDKYAVPIEIIARNRAEYFADEFNDSIGDSLLEDTLPLFEDSKEIHDWAANNMNWSEVKRYAVLLPNPDHKIDFDDGWVNGDWEVK